MCAVVALATGYGCGGSNGNGNNLSSDGGSDATADTGQTDDGGGDSSMTGDDGGDAAMMTDSGGGDTSTGDDGSMGSDASDGGSGDAGGDATSSDGGSSDAASDAPSDASTWDGNTSCSGTNTPCTYDNDAGAAQNGVCQASVCGPCGQDTDCSNYGNGYICVGGACVVGNCRTNTDCASNDAGAVVCVNNTCTACDPVTGGNYYVDPVNGVDGTTSTGSKMAGGQTASVCAFKTIGYALTVISKPTSATTITLLGDDANETTWPLAIPANVTLVGQSATTTVTVPGTATTGFTLNGANSGIQSLVISGSSGTGINAVDGATSSTVLKDITVTGFANGDGVRVSGTNAELTLGEGVMLTKNLNGLHVTGGTSNTTYTEAFVNNPSSTTPSDVFSNNAGYGILIDTYGAVNIQATPGTLGVGSVVATSNALAGSAFQPANAGPSEPQSVVNGLVAWSNGTIVGGVPTAGAGLSLWGGSNVQVRNSYFGANFAGVDITTAAAPSTGGNDTTRMDFGTDAASNAGHNVFQTAAGTATDAGLNAQNGAGVCIDFTGAASGQDLSIEGNLWASFDGSTSLDCTTATTPLSVNGSGCGNAIHADLAGVGVGAATNLKIYTDHCTCTISATKSCQ